MTSQLAGILLPVFFLASIGFTWHKLNIPFDREFLTRLTVNIASPCLIVDTLSDMTIPAQEFVDMLAAGAALFLTTVMVVYVVIRLCKISVRNFLPALAIGNTGNLGLSLCLLAFGQEGMGFAIAVFVSSTIGQFTLTPMLQSRQSPLPTLIKTPVVYAAVIGLVILYGDVSVPGPINSAVELLGALLIPLMLIALGHSLGGLQLARFRTSILMGVARLVIGFLVAHLVAEAFSLEGIARGVIVLQGTMPAAVFSYLFAARYNRVPEEVAGIVLSSTLLSVLSLPLLLIYVLGFAA